MITRIQFNKSTKQFSIDETREFGAKSALLGFLNPGAWIAKETGKYAHDDKEDYKDHRLGYAARGWFAPITSLALNYKVKDMHKKGKSAKQINKWLKDNQHKHAAAAIGELGATNLLAYKGGKTGRIVSDLGRGAATVAGLYQKISGDRKKFNRKKK